VNDVDLLVVVLSLFGSAAAVVVNFYAGTHIVSKVPGSWLQHALLFSAFLALLYHIGYWWLIIDLDPKWSRYIRPVGIAAWFLGPWMGLPLAVMSNAHRLADHMVRKAREVLPEISRAIDPEEE
jgi:hypothetical protein